MSTRAALAWATGSIKCTVEDIETGAVVDSVTVNADDFEGEKACYKRAGFTLRRGPRVAERIRDIRNTSRFGNSVRGR